MLMKQNLLRLATAALIGAASATTPAIAQSEPVTLYGLITYSESGHSNGIHTIEATEGAQPEPFYSDGDMISNGGAVYAEEKCYVLSYLDFFGTMMWWYQIYDFDTDQASMITDLTWDIKDAGSATTYDPVTGNADSICIDATDHSKFTLSTINFDNGFKNPVAPIDQQMCAMAADAKGTLYGIGMDGNLYTIDKFTAKYKLVGPTGIKPQSNQSAVIDWKTNLMYWSAYTADGGALYTVDVKTGQATLLSTYNDRQQIVGLFIRQTASASGAPESVQDISTTFEKATTKGTISFTAPTLDTNGEALSGELFYTVKINEEILARGTTQPGATVKENIVSPSIGDCRFTVYISNASGEGRPASINSWVGPDTPRKVENLTLAVEGSELVLTWQLPERGVNEGYVDPEQTRYTIIRGPYQDMTIDAFQGTEFREPYDPEGVNPHMYLVTPKYEGKNGETAMSNTVLSGEYCEPPYAEDLTDPFRSLVFTTIDANNDECTWFYDWDAEAMKCEWPIEPTSDDWLISAPVMLQADKEYTATIDIRSEGKWNYNEQIYEDVYAGTLSMMLGSEATVEAMSTEVIKPTDVVSMEWHTLSSEPFKVPATGIYHLGLHHSGERSIYNTYLKSFEVTSFSGISAVGPDEAALRASSANGSICIDNPQALDIIVVATDGRVVARTSDIVANIAVAPGLYIIAAPGNSVKVAVK